MPERPPTISHQTAGRHLEEIAARNHTELFCRNAIARGGEVRVLDGLIYTYEGKGHQSMIAFPALDTDQADGQLDEMMEWYAVRPHKGLGCWSLAPAQPVDLGERLKARGFQDGWKPCWMGLEISQGLTSTRALTPTRAPSSAQTPSSPPIPGHVQIIADNRLPLHKVKALPYTGRDGAIAYEMLYHHPEQVQQLVAMEKGQVVGHCAVFFSAGAAGIYNVAVLPSSRGRGIGKALVSAACKVAREQGLQYAVLNATGRKMYEQLGFKWLGDGYTWWKFPADGNL